MNFLVADCFDRAVEFAEEEIKESKFQKGNVEVLSISKIGNGELGELFTFPLEGDLQYGSIVNGHRIEPVIESESVLSNCLIEEVKYEASVFHNAALDCRLENLELHTVAISTGSWICTKKKLR